jgi:predicted nucleic-acid-binding Zn-ribbon protein
MNQFAACPKCRQSNARQLSFTWWGGAIGPKILTHVKCESCGMKYNGKTGRDNTTGIVIYSLVVGIISFIVVFAAAVFIFSR